VGEYLHVSNVEERAAGSWDARISGGGTVGMGRHFRGGFPVTAHVRTRSTVFRLKLTIDIIESQILVFTALRVSKIQ
jgi:hypothetical protein